MGCSSLSGISGYVMDLPLPVHSPELTIAAQEEYEPNERKRETEEQMPGAKDQGTSKNTPLS